MKLLYFGMAALAIRGVSSELAGVEAAATPPYSSPGLVTTVTTTPCDTGIGCSSTVFTSLLTTVNATVSKSISVASSINATSTLATNVSSSVAAIPTSESLSTSYRFPPHTTQWLNSTSTQVPELPSKTGSNATGIVTSTANLTSKVVPTSTYTVGSTQAPLSSYPASSNKTSSAPFIHSSLKPTNTTAYHVPSTFVTTTGHSSSWSYRWSSTGTGTISTKFNITASFHWPSLKATVPSELPKITKSQPFIAATETASADVIGPFIVGRGFRKFVG